MSSNNPNNHVPALSPPSGVTPNFVDPYSLSPAFVVTAVLCLLLATSAVIVRLAITFCGPTKRIRVEDYTCVLSWLGLLETCVLSALEVQKGLGRHQWDVPLANMRHLLKLFYINRIFYSPTILAAKLTILLQLMRIFVPTKRGLVFWLIQTLVWLNVSFYLANVLSVIFQCSPVPKAWNPSIPGACVNTSLNLVVTGAINVLSDVLILVLPLWTIWHLKLPAQKKLSVSVAFAAGIFANFAGIMRLSYSVQIIHGSDLTFLRLQHGMWTIAEITTAIFCASLPLVPQFFKLFHHKSSTFISSASKAHATSSSTGSLRRGSGVESRPRPPRFSPEPSFRDDGGRSSVSASEKEKEVVVTITPMPMDEESAAAGMEAGEEGIRKTIRIEQSY